MIGASPEEFKMKKIMFAMVAAMTLVLSVGATAEAQQRGSDRRSERRDDLDPRHDRRDSRGGIVIDIGVDGIDAYVDYDRRDDRRHRRDDRMDRYRPQRRFVCFAEDRRGRTYRGVDSNPRFAQEHALDRCYAVANRCRPLGCQRR